MRVAVGWQHSKRGPSALQRAGSCQGATHGAQAGLPPSALEALGSLPFLPTLFGLAFSTQGSLYGQILPAATFSLMH